MNNQKNDVENEEESVNVLREYLVSSTNQKSWLEWWAYKEIKKLEQNRDQIGNFCEFLAKRLLEAEHRLDNLTAAAENVISHRVGTLPVQGWLRDNDASRAALDVLAETIAKARSSYEP